MNAFLPKFVDITLQWAMQHRWPAGQQYSAQESDVHTLWMLQTGAVHLEMDGRGWQLEAGQAMLCPPHRTREISTPQGAQWLSVSFSATLVGNVDLLQLMGPPAVWTPDGPDGAALEQVMAHLVREWSAAGTAAAVTPETLDSYIAEHWSTGRASDATSLLLGDAYGRVIAGLCWRSLGRTALQHAVDGSLPPWFSTVLEGLQVDPNVSVDQLARDAEISPAQLRRLFQKHFGTSPREYLNRARLDDARQLLETTDLSAAEIAHRIGFHSPSHFHTLFKTAFGLPPAQYRELSRQLPA